MSLQVLVADQVSFLPVPDSTYESGSTCIALSCLSVIEAVSHSVSGANSFLFFSSQNGMCMLLDCKLKKKKKKNKESLSLTLP